MDSINNKDLADNTKTKLGYILRELKKRPIRGYEKYELEAEIKELLNETLSRIEHSDLKKLLSKLEDFIDRYINVSDTSIYLVSDRFKELKNFLTTYGKYFAPKIDKIDKDEFSSRYDKLLDLLSNSAINSNLVLHTKAENKPFRLFRNSNNSISANIGEGQETQISLTKERLLGIYFDNKEIDNYHHKSYADVVIEKLIDNTIFDEINSESSSLVSEERIKKLEEERLKTTGEISDLKDKVESREKNFLELVGILEESKNAYKNFENAKKRVLAGVSTGNSTIFWKEQEKKSKRGYYIYFIFSILLGISLILSVFYAINHTDYFGQTEITASISAVKNPSLLNYGVLVLYTTLFIWVIKICVKIMLSNRHLYVDAQERVIKINTYLMLLEDGNGFEADDRKVILDNIFKDTNYGIIKDETSVTVADMISAFKSK